MGDIVRLRRRKEHVAPEAEDGTQGCAADEAEAAGAWGDEITGPMA